MTTLLVAATPDRTRLADSEDVDVIVETADRDWQSPPRGDDDRHAA